MKIRFLFALALGVASLLPAQAQMPDAATQQRIQTQVLDVLSASMPQLNFGDIRVTELAGYYRVDVNLGPTLYIADDGSHFFAGEYYQLEGDSFANVTEAENAEQRRLRLAEVADADKIIFTPAAEPRAVLTVFTDVTCSFCRRLHSHIDEFMALGIEIQYLAFPRSGIERNGSFTEEYVQTARAWCAEDRQAALTALKEGDRGAGTNCVNNPVGAEYQLGLDFGVTGTPAIVMPDGTLIPGYRTPAEFAALLGLADD